MSSPKKPCAAGCSRQRALARRLLTNFATIQRSSGVSATSAMATDGRYDTLEEDRRNEKSAASCRRISRATAHRLLDAVFIVDTKKEQIAVDEARNSRFR
jgi:ribosomal protein S2